MIESASWLTIAASVQAPPLDRLCRSTRGRYIARMDSDDMVARAFSAGERVAL